MPAQWTGEIISKMHMYKISRSLLANQLSVTGAYVSMVLNGKREPKNAEQRFNEALNELIKQSKTG